MTTTIPKLRQTLHLTIAVDEVGRWPKIGPGVRRNYGGLVVALIGKADIVVVPGGMALVSW